MSVTSTTLIPAGHERHFTSTQLLKDIVIGVSDGLTVPFALAAGLSGATDATHVVLAAGLAEVAAGAIAMGLGGYLAARTAVEHFAREQRREERETRDMPEAERAEVAQIFKSFGLLGEPLKIVVKAVTADRKRWVDFMMRFELGIEEPDPRQALRSAGTIAAAYCAGGLIPLAPYIITGDVRRGLGYSVLATVAALFGFGFVKGRLISDRPWRSALTTTAIGLAAAAAAYAVARLVA